MLRRRERAKKTGDERCKRGSCEPKAVWVCQCKWCEQQHPQEAFSTHTLTAKYSIQTLSMTSDGEQVQQKIIFCWQLWLAVMLIVNYVVKNGEAFILNWNVLLLCFNRYLKSRFQLCVYVYIYIRSELDCFVYVRLKSDQIMKCDIHISYIHMWFGILFKSHF